MTVPRLELENVEAVMTKEVGEGGRISGLSEYVGCKVLVVVPAQESRRKRKTATREARKLARGRPGA